MYLRKVQYHETDKMGITHHSNYVKWMEEARVDYLDNIGLPYSTMESLGIASPLTEITVKYKSPTTFGDSVQIDVSMREYDGVKLTVNYVMTNAQSGVTVAEAASKHCFLHNGRVISLKRSFPDIHERLSRQLANK